jgi:chromatin remodeling complex protein RSC6
MAKKQSKTSGSKAKKTSKKVIEDLEMVTHESVPVVETPVVDTPVESVSDVESNYDKEFLELQEQLKAALTLVKSLSVSVSSLKKRVDRDRKVMEKKMKGRVKRVVDPNKPPSGFAKPGPVSDELRKFLDLSKDELIARTEVTKLITKYCQKHDLQKKEDKRHIDADAPLRKLLRLSKSDDLTFFNLQKYMKIHYPNKEGVFTC